MFFPFHAYLGADPFQYSTLEIRNLDCHLKGDPGGFNFFTFQPYLGG